MFTTLAISGSYGLFGTEWVRFHAVRIADGIVLRHAVTGATLSGLPVQYINSGQMVRLVADSGRRTNMAAVSAATVDAGRKAYTGWKVTMTLDELCAKFGVKDSDKTLLVATYLDVEDLAA